MLAASRNDRVRGRTVTLTDSINTRNGFNQVGAPSGRKWAINIIGNFIKDDPIIDIQSGRPRISVMIRCLDDLNTYGLRPNRLMMISIMNKVLIMFVIPLILIIIVRISWSIMI